MCLGFSSWVRVAQSARSDSIDSLYFSRSPIDSTALTAGSSQSWSEIPSFLKQSTVAAFQFCEIQIKGCRDATFSRF